MGAVHGRQVGAVLIAKLDRCTRSVADLASLIDTFSRRGVALISAAESLDTSSAGGRSGSGKQPPSARQRRSRCSSSRAAPPAGWRPTGSSSSPGAGHGTRASRKPLQPSSSTAPPASHGRRWPTSSAPPGTAPVPAASGRARAPTRCTGRANVTTKRQRRAPGAQARRRLTSRPTWPGSSGSSRRKKIPARRRSSSRLSRCCFGRGPGRAGRGAGGGGAGRRSVFGVDLGQPADYRMAARYLHRLRLALGAWRSWRQHTDSTSKCRSSERRTSSSGKANTGCRSPAPVGCRPAQPGSRLRAETIGPCTAVRSCWRGAARRRQPESAGAPPL